MNNVSNCVRGNHARGKNQNSRKSNLFPVAGIIILIAGGPCKEIKNNTCQKAYESEIIVAHRSNYKELGIDKLKPGTNEHENKVGYDVPAYRKNNPSRVNQCRERVMPCSHARQD